MAIGIENYPNIDGPDSDYPKGKIRDNTGAGDGTPVDTEVYGDVHQFLAKLLRMAGITANALPDNEYSGFQYIQALMTNGFRSFSNPIIKALLQTEGYIDNDLIVLSGVDITISNSGNTLSCSPGEIYYNGKTYTVASIPGGLTKTGGQVFLYIIDDEDAYTITFITGAPGAPYAIAELGDASVKNLVDLIQGTWAELSDSDLLNSWTLASPNGFLRWKKDLLGNVTVKGYLTSPGSSTELPIYQFPIGFGPKPTHNMKLVSAMAYREDTGAGKIVSVGGNRNLFIVQLDGTPVGAGENFIFHFSYSTKVD